MCQRHSIVGFSHPNIKNSTSKSYSKIWTIRVAWELSFQSVLYFPVSFAHSNNSRKKTKNLSEVCKIREVSLVNEALQEAGEIDRDIPLTPDD